MSFVSKEEGKHTEATSTAQNTQLHDEKIELSR